MGKGWNRDLFANRYLSQNMKRAHEVSLADLGFG